MTRNEVSVAKAALDRGVPLGIVAMTMGVSAETLEHCIALVAEEHVPTAPRAKKQAADADRAAELYSSGLTMKAVAETLGCSVSRVYRLLRRSGVPSRPVGRPQSSAEEERHAAELYQSGMPILDVARELSRSGGWVSDALKRAGVQTRPKGPWPSRRPERDAEIVRRFHAGETAAAIARTLDVSRERVRQILVRAGLQRSQAATAAMQREKRDRAIIEDFRAGFSCQEIGERHGLSPAGVSAALRRNGVAIPRKDRVTVRTREALKLFDAGTDVPEITQRLGYTNEACLRAILYRYGRTEQRRAMRANGAAA